MSSDTGFFLREKVSTSDVPEENETMNFNSDICFDQSNTTDAGQSNYVWLGSKKMFEKCC